MNLNIAINRGSSRLPYVKYLKRKYNKSLYSSQFLRQVDHDKYWVNIDEWRLSRAVNANYSRLTKGEDATIINEMLTGRTNLILAISQWGDWIGLATENTISSSDYCLFLTILIKALSNTGFDMENDVVFIND